jgi:hypothetical protein
MGVDICTKSNRYEKAAQKKILVLSSRSEKSEPPSERGVSQLKYEGSILNLFWLRQVVAAVCRKGRLVMWEGRCLCVVLPAMHYFLPCLIKDPDRRSNNSTDARDAWREKRQGVKIGCRGQTRLQKHGPR